MKRVVPTELVESDGANPASKIPSKLRLVIGANGPSACASAPAGARAAAPRLARS